MKKLVIFNVGGALSCYAEFDGKKVIIDLGASLLFSPVNDFLIPLTKRKNFSIGKDFISSGKYIVDQVFLSHLDRDHISDYKKFRENFHGSYMTCPNDNNQTHQKFRIERGLLGVESESRNLVLDDMLKRTPYIPGNPIMSPDNPLVSIVDEISLFYINPSLCETNETLKSSYANNISLVLFLKVGDKTVLLPGDILKEGMRYLIDNDPKLKNILEVDGIDYLVAPHHGLQTSFSEYLFQTIKGNKTRINIISEKVRTAGSNENRTDVDGRYYSSDYSSGVNSLGLNGVKTSKGHIIIDFEKPETQIKQYDDIDDVINEFCNQTYSL